MPAFSTFTKLPLFLLIAATPLSAATSYKVQSGDTLSSIARKNGTTAEKLMSVNGITNPKLLKVGQTLRLGGQSSAGASPSKKKASTSRGTGSYTVKAGETLYSISRANGVSVSQITAMNPGIDPAKISVGQRINLKKAPAKPQETPKPKEKAKSQPQPSKPKPEAKTKKEVKTETLPPAPKPKAEKPSSTVTNTPKTSPEVVPSPLPAPKTTPKKIAEVIERPAPAPSTISTVTIQKEVSFGALANKHRATTKQLNELNGWSLKPTTVLAKGSEIYVPGL